MGAAASVSHDDVLHYPQYKILGGEAKFNELKGEDDKLDLSKINDPFLAYGGVYLSIDSEPKHSHDFKFVHFDEFPNFTPQHTSLLTSILTPSIFNKLKEKKTSNNVTLSNVILSGIINPSTPIGVAAGDEESYTVFKDLFNPLIRTYHSYDPETSKHNEDVDVSKLNFNDEILNRFNKYVLSTRIKASRNFSSINLPSAASKEDFEKVQDIFKASLASELNNELEGDYQPLESINDEKTSYLKERGFFLKQPSINSKVLSTGAARYWPLHRGIYYNKDENLNIWVNEEDHLRLVSLQPNGDIVTAFNRLQSLLTGVQKTAQEKNSPFLKTENLGYITSCPSNIGTAMKVSVLIKLTKIVEKSKEHPELISSILDIFDIGYNIVEENLEIFNLDRVGVSEVQILQKIINGINRLIDVEEQLESDSKSVTDIITEFDSEYASKRALRVIFTGPPGSGKGTQAYLIKQYFSLNHLSTGDMLRSEIKRETELGSKAKAIMEAGELVPDEIVLQMIAKVINSKESKKGFILDGFPRTTEQAKSLDNILETTFSYKKPIDCVINLDVDDEILIKRVTGRLIHPPSGRTYNIYFNPPKVEGKDDVTGEDLVKRADDNEEKLRVRLQEYHSKTKPVLDHYGEKVINIKSDDDFLYVLNRISDSLNAKLKEKDSA